MRDSGYQEFYTRLAPRRGKMGRLAMTANPWIFPKSVGCGNSQRLHLAVKMAACEAESGGGLRHIPAVLLKLAEDEFALVGAARLVKRGIELLRALRHAA